MFNSQTKRKKLQIMAHNKKMFTLKKNFKSFKKFKFFNSSKEKSALTIF